MIMKDSKFLLGVAVGVILVSAIVGGAVLDRVSGFKFLDKYVQRNVGGSSQTIKILNEETAVVEVAETVSPSVVTIGIKKTQLLRDIMTFNPFSPFGGIPRTQERKIEQDIGTGFVISKDGLIVTNQHVVSDSDAKYRVVTKDDKVYEVENIYRDPDNDLAILKIKADNLVPVDMGDSDKLKVGQFVVAIGTALGEFRHTVTTGVVSGLGRGITAGSPFEGQEELEGLIQTDAAINPGNSGGPLLNSAGQVIGVNTAVSASGQNIGFAIPINFVKEAINNFNSTGQFDRPFLGIAYKIIDQRTALIYEVPEGAMIDQVTPESPAEKAGIKRYDLITKINGISLNEESNTSLAKELSRRKVGDTIELEIWRDGEEIKISVKLEQAKQ